MAKVHLEDADGKSIGCITPIQLASGQTLPLQLGGTGLPVFGRLVAPKDVEVKNWATQVRVAEIQSKWDAYPLPKELQGEAMWRWQLEYAESAEGRARLRNSSHYALKVQPDGSFIVPEVLPGNYTVIISLNEGALGSGPSSTHASYMRQIAFLSHKFKVPEPSAQTSLSIDLSDLVLSTATQ